MELKKDCLVLYKQAPAHVKAIGTKVEISLPGGKTLSVRDKDVVLLHPGPLTSLSVLDEEMPSGQVEEAWELLQGESPSLQELAELVYGNYTPSAAWHSFKLLNRTPWFKGTIHDIIVMDTESVARQIRVAREKEEAEIRWLDFLERFKQKQTHPEKDEIFLRDLEMFALGRSKGSRILKALGKEQNPQNAHRVMVAFKVKAETWNPHPLRLNIPLQIPDYFVGEMPPDSRLDLTDSTAYAIDDEGNQDPDDAIHWDGQKFWVHVADVAALYPANSEIDQAARERASSLYLPEQTIPMLPPHVTERLGLGLTETSPALSYAFSIDDKFNIIGFSVHLTNIRVARLSYEEADRRITEEPFATMKRITDKAAKRRQSAGAITINHPQVKTIVDDTGEISIIPLPEIDSRQMVAEAMLLAGFHAAKMCHAEGIHIPYATQDIDNQQQTQDSSDRTGQPINYAAEFERRRSMKRSRMTIECGPHGGLGLRAYTRVTSPLRRYPDLIASRQIRQHILGKEIEGPDSVLAGLAAFESQIGSLIQAERRSVLFWKLHWLKRRPGYTAEAWLIDKKERQGLFLIPVIALETWVALKKEVQLGAKVVLEAKKVDIAELTALFLIQTVC